MKTKTMKPVLLADYTAPPYLVDEVMLDVALSPQRTKVSAQLHMAPNPAARGGRAKPLVLDGEKLELTGFSLDGRALTRDDYRVSDKALTIAKPRRTR